MIIKSPKMTPLERVLVKEIFYILTDNVLIISKTKESLGQGVDFVF